jgi:hypothetical protein
VKLIYIITSQDFYHQFITYVPNKLAKFSIYGWKYQIQLIEDPFDEKNYHPMRQNAGSSHSEFTKIELYHKIIFQILKG